VPIDVEKAREVIFQPNPGPQTKFLSANEQEVLYGGAAGGGKSYAMLADPVRYLGNEHAKMLLVRKSTEELRELVSVSKMLYPRAIPGIKFLEREKTWVAPSGATLWMSYLDTDDDLTRYQGQAFCVAEGTEVLVDADKKVCVEKLKVGDTVLTLEGKKKVKWTSGPQVKKCVKVSVYSPEGHLLSEQTHPDSHPIALLSSKPYQRLHDLSRSIWQFQKSHLQWLSYKQLQFDLGESRGCFVSEEGEKSYYTKFESDTQVTQQPSGLFYPAVRFVQTLPNLKDGQGDVQEQVGAAVQDPYGPLYGEKDCTLSHTHYLCKTYSHPYTLEQRSLAVQLELCIVYVEPLEDSFFTVYDLNVETANSYITSGGIVNRNCWIGFDELTQWSSPSAWNYMRSRLRTTKNSGLKLYQRATTNPGGAGNQWVKKTFIDPAPSGEAFWATDPETGETLKWPKGHSREGEPLFQRRFIPATLFDNPYLADDGMYEANLLSLPEHQRKQLLEGNWDASEGAAFSEFNRQIHVVEPFDIPSSWPRFRAADYGYSSYSGVLWFAVAPSEQLVVYRELYVSKVLAEDLADVILRAEYGEKMRYGVLDSSLWHKRGDTGPSIAERMILKGCRWRPADRSKGSRIAGKNEIHRRLQVDEYTEEPRLIIFNSCRNLISQLPSIPLSKSNPEDVDTNSEDHLYDALRYGVMTRPRSGLFDYDPNAHNSGFQIADTTFGY
jgi:hypothetical protein